MVLWKIILSMVALGVILGLAYVAEGYLSNPKIESKATTSTAQKNHTTASQIKYEKKLQKAYKQYQEKVATVWGSESVMPAAKQDVTYRDNYKQRSIVDYDEGVVKVELALKPDTAQNNKRNHRQLVAAVKQTIEQSPDDRSIIDIVKQPTPPHSKQPAVLAGLVANIDNSPLSPEELEEFAMVMASAMTSRVLTGNDGNQRVVISTQFKLLPDHIRIQAEKFSASVNAHAQEHDIPAPLVYAIIETESAFNPMAKSPIPAFGLMQLVPRTGARDAYKFLFSKDRILKEKYLYDPDNNIQLGTAYLHLLYFKRFKKIKNPEARTWATIAAYNAGSDSVISAFTGQFSLRNYPSRYSWRRHALKKINNLSAEKLYQHLRRYLPAEETRDYIKKVRDRMDKYGT